MFQIFYLLFRRMLQFVVSGCFKTRSGLHLPPRLSAFLPRRKRAHVEAVPTDVGGPHVLAGGCNRPNMGRGRGGSDVGV
jgi:hypothetical protein